MAGTSSVQLLEQSKEGWRSERIHTVIVDVNSFTLLSFTSSSRLAGLLDSSRSSSRLLARSFDGCGSGSGVVGLARSGRTSFALGDLAESLQMFLNGTGGAVHFIGSKLEEC